MLFQGHLIKFCFQINIFFYVSTILYVTLYQVRKSAGWMELEWGLPFPALLPGSEASKYSLLLRLSWALGQELPQTILRLLQPLVLNPI